MATTPHMSASTLGNIASATSNATSHLTAFPADLAHFLANAASFAFIKVPERLENIFLGGGSTIAEATGNESGRIISAALSHSASITSADSTARNMASFVSSDAAVAGLQDLAFNHVRSLGGFFTYLTSKWALATTVLGLILNRTQIYASMRRHLHLRFPIRLTLRLAPICLLLTQCSLLFQALKCQTSPRYSELKYGSPGKHIELDFAGDGGFLYRISSLMRFLESDEESCRAVGMAPPASGDWTNRKGSVALLWPLFQVLWLAHFVETIVTVLQGRPAAHETGMSIFEHSLAFAEAEGALSNTLGLFSFRFMNPNSQQTRESTRVLLQHLNTTPENLLIALISTLNNLSSQVLGVLDKQAKFRLINTGAWGMCYLSTFAWAFYNLNPESGHNNMIMRLPVVCIVGFTPHLLIIVGIVLCMLIHTLALSLCFLSPPPEIAPLPYKERFKWAFENMQAHLHLAMFRVEMRQDFYTALLQAGFMALTAASEAVFLNERQPVTVAKWTWLEQQRLDAFESQFDSQGPSRRSSAAEGQGPGVVEADRSWKSGYARQKVHKVSKGVPPEHRRGVESDGGVGAFKRARRAINVYFLFSGILQLISTWTKIVLGRSLDKLGISYRPCWLRLPKSRDIPKEHERARKADDKEPLDFWILSEDGILSLPEDENVDVERETRRRLTLAHEQRRSPSPEQLNTHLYEWWKHGGWWGHKDGSGSYAPSDIDEEDTTSVVSMSTNAETGDWTDDDDLSDGRRTPTQHRPNPQRSPSPDFSADHALDPAHLASLLDPQDASTRQEAKMLAYHLTSPNITTRSRYTHAQSFANAKVLTSTRFRPHGSPAGPLSPEEETRLLEQMILSRRTNAKKGGGDWSTGAEGMGHGGPTCVVCQNAPRTVLAWPCRCLSLCEECRVSLAMNNFGTCVCCRQEVGGFSRLFVP